MPKRDESYMAQQREKILIAALHEFSEHGLQKASMRAIAKRVDLNVATLYLHFKNKDAITRGIFERRGDAYPTFRTATFTEMRAIIHTEWSKPIDVNFRLECRFTTHVGSEALTNRHAKKTVDEMNALTLQLFENGVDRDPMFRHLSKARRSRLARHLAYWWQALSDRRTIELGKTNEHLLNDLDTGFDLFIADALRK
jgi:AcrR family transcriptional regulator